MKNLLLPLLLTIITGFHFSPEKQQQVIQNFTLTNATDQAAVSLSDFEKSKAIVVIFTSPSCAFSKIYEERIITLIEEYKTKEVSFILINPNNPEKHPEDNVQATAARAKQKGFSIPYLIDADQRVANAFGAEKTPEAFVLKFANKSFIKKYGGAIDDNPQLASGVSAQYLRDAINCVLSNSPVKIMEKKPTGCMIKK